MEFWTWRRGRGRSTTPRHGRRILAQRGQARIAKRSERMTNDGRGRLNDHPVVSRAAWLAARTALLAKEKEFTRLRDELSRQRRELPWVRVDKPYVFAGPRGEETLADLFEKRSQLIVYHFMFSPEWDEGCKHCSFWADNFNGIGVHLNHRDVTFVAVSRAPLAKIEPFKKRMGWSFKWVSSCQNDFNYDYHVSFTPEEIQRGVAFHNYAWTKVDLTDHVGISVFYKDESGAIFHTYSCYSRGVDMLNGAYHYLDLVPKGRDEDGLQFTQAWVRYHDRYED
jgi:predicted dithiol-disulfide oxidoreductase (DUF899 family)